MKRFKKSVLAILMTLVIVMSSLFVIPADAAEVATEGSGASITFEASGFSWPKSGTVTCYTLSNGRVNTYSDAAATKYTGYISGSIDQCTIIGYNTKYSTFQVKYPASGVTKTAWTKWNNFIYNTSYPSKSETLDKSYTVYTKSNLSKTIGTAYKGDKVAIVSQIGSLSQIVYPVGSNWKMGWIKRSTVPAKTYYVTAQSGLVLRQSASASSAKILTMPYASAVSVTTISNGWAKTTYGGKTGYCSSAYLSTTKPVINKYTPISLNINSQRYNFKQYDSRWKNTKIGTKTIGQIGCTLTCVSMVYSYQNKTNVYPNTMKSKLTFSNNDVNWSSVKTRIGYTTYSYNNCSISQSIMQTVYTQLKAGKPVIIGCKSKSSSGYHWVVITGYTGNSNTLNASSFTINDPNSSSRTNLQQYLNYYPYVYKLVY